MKVKCNLPGFTFQMALGIIEFENLSVNDDIIPKKVLLSVMRNSLKLVHKGELHASNLWQTTFFSVVGHFRNMVKNQS